MTAETSPTTDTPKRTRMDAALDFGVGRDIENLKQRVKKATTEKELEALRTEMVLKVEEFIYATSSSEIGRVSNRPPVGKTVIIKNGVHRGKKGKVMRDYDDGYVEVKGDDFEWDIHCSRIELLDEL